MKRKVKSYFDDLNSAIDFSDVQNVNEDLKEKFRNSIESIREHLRAISSGMVSTKVGNLVDEIFTSTSLTNKAFEKEIKDLGNNVLKRKLREFKGFIEDFRQPEIDLRTSASAATGKRICEVLQGFLGIAEDRGWRTKGKYTKFKMAFGRDPEGITFALQEANLGKYQIVYGNDGTVGTSYDKDIFPELKKPIEQNRLKELLNTYLETPGRPADLSSLHDSRKTEIQTAVSSVQEELNRPEIDSATRTKIQTFTEKLFTQNNPSVPHVGDNEGLRNSLKVLKAEIETFKETRPAEQKQIAEFVLNTLENDALRQPSFDDVPGLRENPRLQRAIADFMLITNIAEAASPTRAYLEFAQSEGILDTSKQYLNEVNSGKQIGEKWSASGRTLGLDSVMRDRLRMFVEDKFPPGKTFHDLDQVFSVKEYPARKAGGGTERGRLYGRINQAETYSPGPSSLEMDVLALDPGPSSSTADFEPDTVDSDESKSKIIDGLRNIDNLGKRSDVIVGNNDDDTEIAAKKARLEADDEYMTHAAAKSLSCDKRQSICSVKQKLVLDADSVELEGNRLSFEFYEPHNKDVKFKVSTEVDSARLSSLKYVAEKEKYGKDLGRETEERDTIGTAFGVHGLVMSVFGAINAFQRGDTVSGAITIAQTLHSLHSFESVGKITNFAADIGKKALQQAVLSGAERLGLSDAAERAATKLSRLAESDAGLLLGDIPFVGLAFDAYFIANDLKDLTTANFSDAGEVALDVVHLALDVGTTVANMLVDTLGPEFEPVVWALSLIRMAVDDFYIDITEELKKAHGTAGKILAVFKGIAEGFVDFITGGLLRSLNQLRQRKQHDTALLNRLANPQSYFRLQGTDCRGAAGTIDFTNGSFSGQGGDITFKLNDNGSFTVQLTGVPAEGGEKRTIRRTFHCNGLRDIVLGVGETQDAVWTKDDAKLWGVITVKSEDVIDHFEANNGSLYGSYTGNSKNNAFYAFQGNFSRVLADECRDPSATGVIDLRIRNYFYLLNGMAGNDSFLLGPQRSHVTGGSGHDLYYLGTHGGNTVIDNFDFDKLSDTLWLNVSHDNVICGRKGYDLLIAYCGTHMVQVKEWFFPVRNDFQRHLVLLTRDGIQLKVRDMGVVNNTIYQVDCVPVSIDRSKISTGQNLNLTEEQFREVVTVTGSMADDTILGNDKDNYINAGPGSNRITGGEGADTYILKSKGGCDIINNYAEDLSQDKIFLPINFSEIELGASEPMSEHMAAPVPDPSIRSQMVNPDLTDLRISKTNSEERGQSKLHFEI